MKRARWAALICILALLTGCWSRHEIETLGFTLASGIDWDEENQLYEVTIQMVKPQVLAKQPAGGGVGGGQGSAWVFTARARTVLEAVRMISTAAPKKVWWGHSQVLVIGEAAARRGLQPALDLATRDGESRRLFFILITPGRAREILEVQSQSARVGALGLLEISRQRRVASESAAVRFHDFLIMLASGGRAATTGVVRLVKDGPVGGATADFTVSGAAVIVKDRLIGYLSPEETRSMLLVQGEFQGGVIHTTCPGTQEGPIVFEIRGARSRITPAWKNGRPSATVKIRAEADIGDKECPITLQDPSDIDRVREHLEETVSADIERALDRAREMRADVFGFGTRFEQEMPHVWRDMEKNWEEGFSEMQVDVLLEVRVRRKGLQAGTAVPRESGR